MRVRVQSADVGAKIVQPAHTRRGAHPNAPHAPTTSSTSTPRTPDAPGVSSNTPTAHPTVPALRVRPAHTPSQTADAVHVRTAGTPPLRSSRSALLARHCTGAMRPRPRVRSVKPDGMLWISKDVSTARKDTSRRRPVQQRVRRVPPGSIATAPARTVSNVLPACIPRLWAKGVTRAKVESSRRPLVPAHVKIARRIKRQAEVLLRVPRATTTCGNPPLMAGHAS